MWQKILLAAFVLLFIGLLAHRVARYVDVPKENREQARDMPVGVAAEEERDLYFSPGGKYTLADIQANGHTTPSQKYRNFRAKHDHNPKPGDRLCPVTRTRANPDCTWIISGEVYQFCCPPCIDEFVQLAKEQPEQIKPSERYVK